MARSEEFFFGAAEGEIVLFGRVLSEVGSGWCSLGGVDRQKVGLSRTREVPNLRRHPSPLLLSRSKHRPGEVRPTTYLTSRTQTTSSPKEHKFTLPTSPASTSPKKHDSHVGPSGCLRRGRHAACSTPLLPSFPAASVWRSARRCGPLRVEYQRFWPEPEMQQPELGSASNWLAQLQS